MSRLVALIPAAGYSARMGFFKPLQPLQSSLLIEKPIETVRSGGIDDIRVIVGYKKELLYPVLSRLGVSIIENENYDKGMFSSIQCGVRTLDKDIEAFLVLPADYPCVIAETIKRLVGAYDRGKGEVIYPSYQGRRGHPPLISAKYRRAILYSQPEDNLRTVLDHNVTICQEIEVNDPGIRRDLDIGSDYMLLKGTDRMHFFPAREECMNILGQMGVSEKIIRHLQTVSIVAVRIAEYLNSAGYHLNLGLVLAGSLLHDIAKGQKDHALKGKEMINRLGYPGVAKIVGTHMDISLERDQLLTEAAVVYLADKLVQEDRIVSLEKRFSRALVADDLDVRKKAVKRLEDAELIKAKVEKVIKGCLTDLLESP